MTWISPCGGIERANRGMRRQLKNTGSTMACIHNWHRHSRFAALFM
jgi:hypothetical protein